MTKYPDLFAALASPFEANEVKSRTQAGRQLHYITARVAMNRLDDVLGPESWWDRYRPGGENSVVCALTIRLPDGTELTKEDVGGAAGMADAGDDDKSQYSDAFKRAAVKFGCGRYLYRDGVPTFVQERAPDMESTQATATAATANGDGQKSYPAPRHGGALYAWAKEQGQRFDVDVVKWLDTWGKRKNLPGNFKEWAPGEITEGYNAAVAKLNSHVTGQVGKSEDNEQ